MASGLTARRLILQQLTAVMQHSPLGCSLALIPLGRPTTSMNSPNSNKVSWFGRLLIQPEKNRGTFTLMTEEEMEYLRRRREDDGDEARVVLSTRPTRQISRGIAGSMLNVVLSFFLSPILALSVSLEAVRLGGLRPHTFILAPAVGLTWGAVFFVIAWYAAAQQLLLCFFYQLEAPVVYLCRSGYCWNEFACRYEYPSGVVGHSHPLLALEPSEEKLRERAMRRESRRQQRGEKKRPVTYERARNNNNNSGRYTENESDYYAVLGVARDATPREIREAYNRLVLEVHPDKNPNRTAAAQFDAVTKAYRVLSNAEKRRKYDIGGKSGVDDVGAKKREALRALFGGDELHRIVGDVRTGSFSQRVLDGLDWTQEELAICRQRMIERCRDVLITSYLQPLEQQQQQQQGDSSVSSNNNNNSNNNGAEVQKLKDRLRRLLNTGLAKEVLYAVGKEYLRVVKYSETTGSMQRLLLFLQETAPHRLQRRLDKWRCLSRVRQHTFKDSAAMVDLAWYVSVEELESTARCVATAILLDPEMDQQKRQERREALRVLAETFVAYGQPYKGANKQTMDTLMNSLREYQHQQQKQKESN
ncbi:putative chaperone protein DNAj [Trypanosoma theileri]|uniref:Putative chaperone protein DNAj n=1 Tax=Trypanosoma theileri TaxID=67003 RepID=A0A1X0NS91_9TRYP|nr:putative chaperone protein DNAj [Trypanosoma theileri]ORC87557.1 putative chaperone protein DNAj [Trypanosoma theileri]